MFDNIEVSVFNLSFESDLSFEVIVAKLRDISSSWTFGLNKVLLTRAGTWVYTLKISKSTYLEVKALEEFIKSDTHKPVE